MTCTTGVNSLADQISEAKANRRKDNGTAEECHSVPEMSLSIDAKSACARIFVIVCCYLLFLRFCRMAVLFLDHNRPDGRKRYTENLIFPKNNLRNNISIARIIWYAELNI